MRGGPVSARPPWLRPFARSSGLQSAVTAVPTDSPVGEVLVTSDSRYNIATTVFEWRVPKNVRRVSVLGITAGTTGAYGYDYEGYPYYIQGFPGALGYLNDMPVTPGEVLTVRVQAPVYYTNNSSCTIHNAAGTLLFVVNRVGAEADWMLTRVFRSGNQVVGAPGYLGVSQSGYDAPFGTGAAGVTGGTAPFGIGYDSTSSTPGFAGSRNDPTWPVFGALFPSDGGGSYPNSAGCVRIIWGPGRSFPFNARKIN